jgi:uncharacterized protein YhaN
VIYGPNEAGKSTTLRAIIAFLYGIEQKTPDAFLHGGPNLRIGARLCDASGHELSLYRRKGVKNTLLDERGEPADEALLARMLGGVSQAAFLTTFGLDHERLREGGEQLGRGRGELGESLFQAGVGALGVHDALRSLRQEADELFKPRGKRQLNEAVRAYDEARRQVRDHARRAEGFREQEQGLARERERRAELEARRHALLEEQSRLQRALRVLPGLARRAVLLDKRAELGDAVELPPDAAEARRAAEAELAACDVQAAHLRKAAATIEGRVAELVVPESLSALSAEYVRRIRNRLGGHLKAAEDVPNRRAELRALELEAAAIMRGLGRPIALADVERLRVDSATLARIQKLAAQRSGLLEKADAAARDLALAEGAIARAQAEIANLAADARPAARAALHAARLPSEATVAEHRRRFERVEHERGRLRDAADALEERSARVQRALDVLAHEGAPPTERDLTDARAERDARWRTLRAALAGEGAGTATRALPEAAAFTAYEAAQQRADELADRLRREARRVSEQASLLAERDAIARERERHARREAAAAEDARAALADWNALFAPLGVTPRPPIEMQPLLVRIAGLLEGGESGRLHAERNQHEAQRALSRFQAEWADLMARLSLPPGAGVEEAHAVLETLRRLFEKVDAIAQLQKRIDTMARDAQQFDADVRALLSRHLPEHAALPLEQAAEELTAGHARACRDLEQRAHLERDLAETRAQLEALDARAERATQVLDGLMRAARVSNREALEAAEQRSQLAHGYARALAEVESELLVHGEGAGIEALIAQTAELSPDRLRARLEELKDELESIAEEHTTVVHRIGSVERGLDLLRQGDDAALAAVEAEQHLARVQALARSYAKKKLAIELLARQIRSYQEQHQAPIMSRAGALFARLTLGRYRGLSVGYKGGDEPLLLCVDARGATVEISALSDGTRDQLYLALRLASLSRFAERNEPMPLVLDDVLIHFDDERARAALQVLGEFAQTAQVLFFTHHARLCELSRQAVPPEQLVEHRLLDAGAAVDSTSRA